MHTGEIAQRDVITVRPQDELLAAARLMREKHVGFLVVVEPMLSVGRFRPVGVLTDRDIVVTVVARDANPKALIVEDVMTRNPVTARADAPLDAALRDMRRIGVRRLPIVDDGGALYGVLALDDVIATFTEQLQHVAGSIRSEQLVERALRP